MTCMDWIKSRMRMASPLVWPWLLRGSVPPLDSIRMSDQITPVLKAFHDQVLFLKHNLNSRAIGSLKGTSTELQGDVADLVKSIDASSQEADKLISSLAVSDN